MDFILDRGFDLLAIEAKSGATASTDYFAGLARFAADMTSSRHAPTITKVVVYGGDISQRRTAGELLSWSNVDRFTWTAPSAGKP